MINAKVIQALKPLNIPVNFMEYSGSCNAYLIFSTTGANYKNYQDDESTAELTRVSLTFWYKDISKVTLINEIKKLMKANGFRKLTEKDVRDDGYFGRAFTFSYFEELQ